MKNLLWLDMEMTGLDERTDSILEIAVLVTTLNFETKASFHRVIFQPNEILSNMNDWCKKTHKESGLTALIPSGTPLKTAEAELLELTKLHFQPSERIILCGNSIWNDRKFIDLQMPDFAKRLHYRMIDVSSFKEIYRERYGISFTKKNGHRALDDVQESINELTHYLSFIDPKIQTKS